MLMFLLAVACGLVAASPDDACDGSCGCSAAEVAGRLKAVLPSDAAYADDRQQFASYNMHYEGDVLPGMIAYVADEAGVKSVLAEARQCGFAVVIRSGGHHVGGQSSCETNVPKCIQLDVSGIKHLSVSDGIVTMGPGVKQNTMFDFFAEHGIYFPTAESYPVAFGGLTQSAGFSDVTRVFGGLVDRVTEYTVVLASGETVVASATEHTDLFKALRGGSPGTLGVAIEIKVSALLNSDFPEAVWFRVRYELPAGDPEHVIREMFSRYGDLMNNPIVKATYDKSEEYQINVEVGNKGGLYVSAHGIYCSSTPFAGSPAEEIVNYFASVATPTSFEVVPTTLSEGTARFTSDFVVPDGYTLYPRSLTAGDVPTAFLERTADKLTALYSIPGYIAKVQLNMWGGAFYKNDPDHSVTSVPIREAKVYFDLQNMFTDANLAMAHIWKLHTFWHQLENDEVWQTAWKRYNIGGPRHGLTDMADPRVWKWYYDEAMYKEIGRVKLKHDPDNLFSSSYGVPAFDDAATPKRRKKKSKHKA